MSPSDDGGREVQYALRDTARDRLGNRVEGEADLRFPEAIGETPGPTTEQGNLGTLALSDGPAPDQRGWQVDLGRSHA